jgi:hypothetical protein
MQECEKAPLKQRGPKADILLVLLKRAWGKYKNIKKP